MIAAVVLTAALVRLPAPEPALAAFANQFEAMPAMSSPLTTPSPFTSPEGPELEPVRGHERNVQAR